MKILLFIVLLFSLPDCLKGQITTAIVKANFGIDADLRANYFNGLASGTGDDWYNNGTAGTGQFIIDTTGAAGIIAGYVSNPASRMRSFSRLMRQAPYSLANSKLLLDAVFHRDFHGNDSTVFASGSNKNGMSPASWSCPVTQNIPDKNDILDAFVHVRRDGPNVNDSAWMFGGISIQNITGNRYFDFELYQTDISYNRSTLTFSGYGPDLGHTSWKFDASGNIITPGDIIFSAEFGSAGITLVEARIWVHRDELFLTVPAAFNWGVGFDGGTPGAVYGYASIRPKTTGAFYTGIQSAAGTWAGPFGLVQQDNSVVNNYVAKQFMEFSVNLTKLGIDPATFSSNPCGSPFRRVLIKSRASTSFTAELKDFIAPFSMFNYPPVDANAFLTYFCGTMPVTPINVQNPNPNSIYTWSTVNGNIVSPPMGTSILVNAPGTYYVRQRLNMACPFFSNDSVTIFFDPVCIVLNVDFIYFQTATRDRTVELKWKIDHNEQIAGSVIELSTDNIHFNELITVPAENRTGATEYTYQYDRQNYLNGTVYFRIKAMGRNEGSAKFSQVRSVSMNGLKDAIIFPNPVSKESRIQVYSDEKEIAVFRIWDQAGKLIAKEMKALNIGLNHFELPQLVKGVYLIGITSRSGEANLKAVVK